MLSSHSKTAVLLLARQLKGIVNRSSLHIFLDITQHPIDGVSVGLIDENNLFEWQVCIVGPSETL